jgi:hypothetical protein
MFSASLPNHQQTQEFLQRNMLWILLFTFGWMIVGFGWRYYRYKRRAIVFPDIAPEDIRFQERRASGHSNKTLFTKLGGVRNCLHITVTDTEVWLRLPFLLGIFAQDVNLEHRISRTSIASVQMVPSRSRRRILLEYRDDHGQLHGLSLILRDPNGFLRALNL